MLLEAREGEAAVVPARSRSRPGSSRPTPQLQQFYAANRARYMIPEQRVLRIARIGPEQVADVTASDQEIAAYYNANQATYGAKETRSSARPWCRTRRPRTRIAARAKAGADARRGRCAGGRQCRGHVARGPDPRRPMRRSPATRLPAAVFAAPSGAVVGPVQSDFGWVVVEGRCGQDGRAARSLAQAQRRDRRQADRRQAQECDRGPGRQGPERDRRRQQFRRGGGRSQAAGHDDAADHRRRRRSRPIPLQAAAGARSRAQDRLRDRAERPAGDRHARRTMRAMRWSRRRKSFRPPLLRSPDPGRRSRRTGSTSRRCSAPRGGDADRRQGIGRDVARRGGEAGRVAAPAGRSRSPRGGSRSRRARARSRRALQLLFTLGAGQEPDGARPAGRGFFVVKVDKIMPGNAMLAASADRPDAERASAERRPQDYARQFLAAIRARTEGQAQRQRDRRRSRRGCVERQLS